MKHILVSITLFISIALKAQVAITIPAEYEQNSKLLLTWSYIDSIDSVICEITGIAKQQVDVDIIFNPNNIQYDTAQIKYFLSNLVGVDEYSNDVSDFSIAPNPTSGNFKILSSDQFGELEVSIYNLEGQLIISTKSNVGSIISTGDLLKPGYYTVIINKEGISSRSKLVIK